MKLTRNQIVELNYVLRNTNWVHDKENPIKSGWRYVMNHNITVTDKEIEETNNIFPTPPKYIESIKNQDSIIDKYSALEIDLHKKYGIAFNAEEKKYNTDDLADEVKESLLIEHKELKAKYTTELKANSEKYKDSIEEYEAIQKEKVDFLKEEVDLDLRKAKINVVPDISADNKHPHWEIWRVIELIVE